MASTWLSFIVKIGFITIVAVEVTEAEGDILSCIVLRNIEFECTTGNREVISCERLGKMQFFRFILCNNIHLVDVRIQRLQSQRNRYQSLFARGKSFDRELHSVVVESS